MTDSKDGEGNDLDKHLPDTDVVSNPLFSRPSLLEDRYIDPTSKGNAMSNRQKCTIEMQPMCLWKLF